MLVHGDWNAMIDACQELIESQRNQTLIATDQLRACRLMERGTPDGDVRRINLVVKVAAAVIIQRVASDFDITELADQEGVLALAD